MQKSLFTLTREEIIMLNKQETYAEEIFKKQFKEKLREVRKKAKLSRQNASKLIGVATSTLQGWEEENNDRVPSAWDTQKIIQAYDLPVDYFFSKTDSPILVNGKKVEDAFGNSVDPAEFVFIPRYNVKAAAGHGAAIQNENIMHHMAFRKYWIDNVIGVCAKDLVVIGVTGDSMAGEINNGDVILINTADKHLNNGIYVIRINGDLIVKRIQKMPGNQIQVISANKEYESYSIDLNNLPSDFECIGRVVWHGRNIV